MEVKCPKCDWIAPDSSNMYEEPEIFDSFWRTWYYVCPDCGAAYRYSRIYKCVDEEIELLEDED